MTAIEELDLLWNEKEFFDKLIKYGLEIPFDLRLAVTPMLLCTSSILFALN